MNIFYNNELVALTIIFSRSLSLCPGACPRTPWVVLEASAPDAEVVGSVVCYLKRFFRLERQDDSVEERVDHRPVRMFR